MIGSNKMSLTGWRALIEWSFQYSMVTEQEKEDRLSIFKKEWEEFCTQITETYGNETIVN